MRFRDPAVREDVRDSILDAANRLIERFGYRKTTIEDVAREAGIGKGTVYLHFPSKEEVALSCGDRTNARLCERLRSLAREERSPAERLRRMLVERVMFRLDAVTPYGQSLDDILAAIRPRLHERRARWQAAEAEILAEVLIEGRLLGAFDPGDPAEIARTLLDAGQGLMPLSLSQQELTGREAIRLRAERLADLLLKGLLRREPGAAP